MARSLYLVSPVAGEPTYFGAEVFAAWGLSATAFVADLALPTVAALADGHLEVRLCDEDVTPVDLDTDADVVGLTGKVNQWGRMRELADHFRARGRTVVVGGPYASLSPEVVVPHCDVLVRGELEDVASELFSDLAAGRAREEYAGGRPDPVRTPVPRWDLYANDRTLVGVTHTSRGCPFDCEFCDVAQYLGRPQRHRPVRDVLADLDALYAHGYRDVFLADDNLTAHRPRARELLAALARWNARRDDGTVAFTTQASVDAARDPELLRLLAEAGVNVVFLGLETPNEAALAEAGKRHNLDGDPVEAVRRFAAWGIAVIGGLMVGFDADGPDIFDRQRELVEAAAVPFVSLGAVVAPDGTRLHARLAREGRLVPGGNQVGATPWDTNVVPAGMSREALLAGLDDLVRRLFTPEAYGRRLLGFIEAFGSERRPPAATDPRRGRSSCPAWREARSLLKRVIKHGPEEERMCLEVFRATAAKPEAADVAASLLLRYAQVRFMLDRR